MVSTTLNHYEGDAQKDWVKDHAYKSNDKYHGEKKKPPLKPMWLSPRDHNELMADDKHVWDLARD